MRGSSGAFSTLSGGEMRSWMSASCPRPKKHAVSQVV
jgi:hypothetical protein